MDLAFTPLPTILQTSYRHFNMWCPLALVVTEIVLRWKMVQEIPRVQNPLALRVECYEELAQGLVLLGLTTQAVHWKSGMLLATITVVALGRLYGSLKIVRWVKGLNGQGGDVTWTKPDRTYFDFAYDCLQDVGLINLCGHALLFNSHHPMQGFLTGAVTFVLPALISKVFERMVTAGYWNQPECRLSSLKIERMQTCMCSLLQIRTAFAFGLFGKYIHFLGPEIIKIENFAIIEHISLFGIVVYCWGYSLVRHKSFLARWAFGSRAATAAINTSNQVAKRLMFKYAYTTSVWNIADELAASIIKGFGLNVLDQAQMQIFFSIICIECKTHHIVKALKECNCLTPDFLSTKQKLWECLNDEQIQAYLLTPEIQQLLQGDNIVKTEKEMESLTEEIGEAEKRGEKSFSTLRLLRERVEKLSFAKANDFLSRVPNGKKPIIVTLNSLKTKIQQREKDIAVLEQRLETMCEDIKLAYEGIPHFREEDMKKVLEQADVLAAGQNGTVLFNLLATLGIKWKGDLATHNILQSGDNANSRELLVARLVKFIQEKNV